MLMVAAVGFEELHSTEAVMSSVLLSLKVPVAANCLVVPTAMLEGLAIYNWNLSANMWMMENF